jgi:hypothetical protein
LAPLFGALNLDAHVHDKSLESALEWSKRRGVNTVADLRELPAAALTDLVGRLRLPPIKARRLRAALEGAPRDGRNAAGDDGSKPAATCQAQRRLALRRRRGMDRHSPSCSAPIRAERAHTCPHGHAVAHPSSPPL